MALSSRGDQDPLLDVESGGVPQETLSSPDPDKEAGGSWSLACIWAEIS